MDSLGSIDIQQLSESVLLELYFGDSAVEKLQEQFTKFRSKYVGGNWTPKINYDPDLIKFNRLCEDQFGYYRFCLSISPVYDYNAFMINVGYLAEDNIGDTFFSNLKIYKNNKGFYYDKAAKVSAITNIYFGLLSDKRFTDREVFAIMLHEIGHSFTYAVLNRDGVIGGGSCLINIVRKVNAAINNNLQKDRDFSDKRVESDIQSPSITSRISNFVNGKFNIKNAVYSLSKTVKGMRQNVKHYGYTNEKFADTFASMYGYSSELQIALQKLTDAYRDFNKNPKKKPPGDLSVIIMVGLLSANNMIEFLLNMKDEHPDGLTRIKVQIEYLEKELRNVSLDPKMKMDLQRHLAIQMQIIKDFIDSSKDPDVSRAYNTYYTKLYEKYGGDIREKFTDNEAIFDTIDQRYNDISKNESAIDDLFRSPLNELFGIGKKKEKTYFFPRDKYDEIVKKYQDKKKLPPTSLDNLEICAHIFCNYKTSDLDKFCNAKDTNDLIKFCTNLYENEKHSMDYEDESYLEELDKLKRNIDKIKPNSICKIVDNNQQYGIWYDKTNHSFYFNNPDESTFLSYPRGISYVHEDIGDSIFIKYKYRVNKIEPIEQEESKE